MTPFLQYVANDLKLRFGNNLSRLMVVFPNRRAGLFMNEYLVGETHASVWAPQYSSIRDLFLRMSPLRPVDTIEAVCRLYRIFCRATERTGETLDAFYGWGERLLDDFDDVDKQMADARQLFSNVHDLTSLESNDFLTDEQRRAVEHFFGTHPDDMDALRRAFEALWEKMYAIYSSFRTELAADGLGTDGQIYRQVAEALQGEADIVAERLPEAETFVFVGFNVLNEVELALFRHLKKTGRALFYWDYDEYYIDKDDKDRALNEAGSFLIKNLEEFPNALHDTAAFCNFEQPKTMEIVASSSDNAQARSVTDWLDENLTTDDEKRTAVVLCNETLLLPVLHSLPERVKSVNVTKGYPLSHTEAFAFADRRLGELLREQTAENEGTAGTAGSAVHLAAVLRQLATDLTTAIFDRPEADISAAGKVIFRDLHNEAYFQTYKTVERFCHLVEDGYLNVEPTTLRRLLKAVLRSASVPFHGEPAEGVQVMGLLETRNLDFERIIMLSVNEGDMPRKAQQNSFIPHFLRVAYGLTTPQHQTAIFAYHFYRLMSRAERVRLVYQNGTDGMQKKEPSRFINQLLVEAHHLQPCHLSIKTSPKVRPTYPESIEKPKGLAARFDTLSPTALKSYFKCQRLFHYKYVLNLPEPQTDEGLISANHFGSVFHKAAELIYKHFGQRTITRDDLLRLRNDTVRLEGYIRQSFVDVSKDNKKHNEPEVPYTVIVASIIMTYLKKLLESDAAIAPLRIMHLERERSFVTLHVPVGGQVRDVKVGGTIDRLDILVGGDAEVVRVVDYKTGAVNDYAPKGDMERAVDVLFDTEGSTRQPLDVFQTFIYGLAVQEIATDPSVEAANIPPLDGRSIVPSLYYTREGGRTTDKVRNGYLVADCFAQGDVAERFRARLTDFVAEIFDESRPFAPPTKKQQEKACDNCAFHTLCYF